MVGQFLRHRTGGSRHGRDANCDNSGVCPTALLATRFSAGRKPRMRHIDGAIKTQNTCCLRLC